jgi:predicted dehydrogenase
MSKLRIAIVGCGDVAHRFYLPPLASLADRVEMAGLVDARLPAAERAAEVVRGWSPAVRAFERLEDLLEQAGPDGIFNLTPAPLHGQVSRQILDAGVNLYSEKPIAATVAEADGLIELARSRGLTFLCAPAPAITARIRWLRGIIDSGRLGHPTLITAQCASMGPASWLEYTGDPTVFYGPGVGPIRDLGVYRLHEMIALLGPVGRVQATGAIAIPQRLIMVGPRAGDKLEITSPDHMLLNLEFAGGALGQLTTSFAVPATRSPYLELHLSAGSISLTGDGWSAQDAGAVCAFDPNPTPGSGVGDASSIFEGPPDAAGWRTGPVPPEHPDPWPVVSMGPLHFVACLRGEEKPVLTPEQARHVLEIILAAYRSVDDGRRQDLTTSF